jgi:uncharacterized protein (TIGR03067 family)
VAGLIYRAQAAEQPKARRAAEKDGKEKPLAAKKDRKPKPDEERLRGTWKLVGGAEDGKKGKAEDGDLDAVITVRGETLHMKVTAREGGTPVTDRFFVFRLDATTTPKSIDLADWQKGLEDNDEVIEGVYSLDDDTFTICLGFGALSEGRENKDRPTRLEPKKGSKTTAWTFKKEKKGR